MYGGMARKTSAGANGAPLVEPSAYTRATPRPAKSVAARKTARMRVRPLMKIRHVLNIDCFSRSAQVVAADSSPPSPVCPPV